MSAADQNAIDDPSIEAIYQRCRCFLRPGGELLVEFVEVKSPAYDSNERTENARQRIALGRGIERPANGNADQDRSKTRKSRRRRVDKRREKFAGKPGFGESCCGPGRR